MRKVTSKSFTQKHQLPTNLPPLCKRQSNQDPQKQVYPPTSRPPFIIRSKSSDIIEKNLSFLQSCTTRKQPLSNQDQRKMMNETGSQLNKENNGKNMQQQAAKTNLRNSEDGRKTTQPRARQALSSNMQIDQDVSLCKVQIQEFVENKSQCFRKKKYKISENNLLQKLTKNMANAKSLKKKRKIEECKTRKINWGSNKNDVFNLGISVIKLNKEENVETPVQSLKQLYIQIL